MLVTSLGDLVDLCDTFFIIKTGSELADGQGDSKIFSIFVSLSQSLCMPILASLLVLLLRLTCSITCLINLTAVSVVVEDMMLRSKLGTRRLRETKMEDKVVIITKAHSIWYLGWLKPHIGVVIPFSISCIYFFIHRLQIVFVKVSGVRENHVKGVLQACPGWGGFVSWIETNDEFVFGKILSHFLPKSYILILDSILIGPKCSENRPCFGGGIILVEFIFLAILNQWITVFVFPKIK